jgi:SAM-dependent methyltransferase
MDSFRSAERHDVVASYDQLAPYYDAFTAGYDYSAWADSLETLAIEHGLAGRRLLDVACGTGKSFLPFLARGYSVTACDICPAMVAIAGSKIAPGAARLVVADMRELPDLGHFDLVTCLDDAINYLLADDELVAALRAMADCLAPGGLLVFDCNSRATYDTSFRTHFIRESEDLFFSWRGATDDGLATAMIDIFERQGTAWQRETSNHVQRYHSRTAVLRGLERAGLEVVAVRGQSPGGRLDLEVDEERHTKIVYLARRNRD